MSFPSAVIFGMAGPALRPDERRFFREADPLGFILFARNVESPAQVRALIQDLRASVGRADAPVLIDQEGGRVARLIPPHWRAAPPAKVFGGLYARDPARAREATRTNHRLLATELAALGITVDCAPVLDVPVAGAHDVIGDRAFAHDPAIVADLGRVACDGLLAGGVLPMIKHVPGHGRARADSHKELPTVDAPLAELQATDFAPFKKCRDAPWAMTAHVLYTALDRDRPATLSPVVIENVIRRHIGFDGVLVSDDIGMSALKGDFRSRAESSLRAGCDVVLHCSGDAAEMLVAAEGVGSLTPAAAARVAAAEARRTKAVEPMDPASGLAALDSLLA